MSSKKRKYFNSSIHDLREICNKNKDDKDILAEVYEELTYRKTRGAVELRNKLEAFLDNNKPANPSEAKKQPKKTKEPTKPTNKKQPSNKKPKDSVGFDEPPFTYQHNFTVVQSNQESTSQNTKWQIKLREDKKYYVIYIYHTSI